LDRIHRQAERSGIVSNGDRILKRSMPTRLDDFSLKVTDKPILALEDYIFEARDRGVDFGSLEHQIIVPGNRFWTGTHKLNAKLSLLFQPENDGWIELERHEFRHKDVGK